jgi:hypothetical protein
MENVTKICRDWLVSMAQLELECCKAGDDDKLVAAACKREDRRIVELTERLIHATPTTGDEIEALVSLARKLMKNDFNLDPVRLILKSIQRGLWEKRRGPWSDSRPASGLEVSNI